jgi:hypothetical protein
MEELSCVSSRRYLSVAVSISFVNFVQVDSKYRKRAQKKRGSREWEVREGNVIRLTHGPSCSMRRLLLSLGSPTCTLISHFSRAPDISKHMYLEEYWAWDVQKKYKKIETAEAMQYIVPRDSAS